MCPEEIASGKVVGDCRPILCDTFVRRMITPYKVCEEAENVCVSVTAFMRM